MNVVGGTAFLFGIVLLHKTAGTLSLQDILAKGSQYALTGSAILAPMEATCGNRVVISVNVVGGVRRDLSPEQCLWIEEQLKICEKEVKQLQGALLSDYTVKKRTVGKGVLTKEQAYQLGAAGPTLRGSGWAQDARQTGYAAFGELGFEPIVEYDGDCYARTAVRFRECLQSIDLIRLAIARMEWMVSALGNWSR